MPKKMKITYPQFMELLKKFRNTLSLAAEQSPDIALEAKEEAIKLLQSKQLTAWYSNDSLIFSCYSRYRITLNDVKIDFLNALKAELSSFASLLWRNHESLRTWLRPGRDKSFARNVEVGTYLFYSVNCPAVFRKMILKYPLISSQLRSVLSQKNEETGTYKISTDSLWDFYNRLIKICYSRPIQLIWQHNKSLFLSRLFSEESDLAITEEAFFNSFSTIMMRLPSIAVELWHESKRLKQILSPPHRFGTLLGEVITIKNTINPFFIDYIEAITEAEHALHVHYHFLKSIIEVKFAHQRVIDVLMKRINTLLPLSSLATITQLLDLYLAEPEHPARVTIIELLQKHIKTRNFENTVATFAAEFEQIERENLRIEHRMESEGDGWMRLFSHPPFEEPIATSTLNITHKI